MLYAVLGVGLILGSSGGYWYLLPRNGQVHPLVRNSDIGSIITITIMALLTLGIGLLAAGLIA